MSKEGRVGPVMPTAGGAQVNESTPMEQRMPDKGLPLSAGPIIGEKGEYKPAKYEVQKGEFTFIVEDR